MKYVIIIKLLLTICSITAIGQNTFDKIKICNSPKQEIKQVFLAGYYLNFKAGRLQSAKSENGAVQYNESDKFITINLYGDRKYNLKLTKDGLLYFAADTSFLINSMKSIGIKTLDTLGDVYSVLDLKNASMAFVFEKNKIKKVYLMADKIHVSISVFLNINGLMWDIAMGENNDKQYLAISYAFKYPYYIFIQDKDKYLRVVTHLSKKSGEIYRLEGSTLDIYGNSANGKLKVQRYSKHGVLKKDAKVFGVDFCN